MKPSPAIRSGRIDVKRSERALYHAPTGSFELIDVPELPLVMVDGHGDPNRTPQYLDAVHWLYASSYAARFALKAEGLDYVVPPLEGLWWADDPSSFVARRKDEWRWTMMIRAPAALDQDRFAQATGKAAKKLGTAPPSLRLARLAEGRCLQTLHIGAYDDEGPTLARLHDEVMPAQGWTFAGPHHEIYLSDPRRTDAARLKTILRQPVRSR